MRLRQRETLRPPQRYGEGPLITPSCPPGASDPDASDASKPEDNEAPPPKPRVRIMPATARPAFPPPYIDYNPSTPPAAFPTIDRVRPRTAVQQNEDKNEGSPCHRVARNCNGHGVSAEGYDDG